MNNILAVALLVVIAFAAMPQWITLIVGIFIGILIRINIPNIKRGVSWN